MTARTGSPLRVLIIGTSHLGALKSGWAEIAAAHPRVSAQFFGISKAYYSQLRLSDDLRFGLLDPAEDDDARAGLRRMGFEDNVDLTQHDVVILSGLPWHWRVIADLMIRCDIDGLPESDAPARLSSAAYAAVCDALMPISLPEAGWRGWSGPKLVCLPSPVGAETIVRDRPIWRRHARHPGRLVAAFDLFLDRLEASLAADGIGLLRQPAASFAKSGLTDAGYNREALMLNGTRQYSERDHLHMNARYGALCLESFLSDIPRWMGEEPATESKHSPLRRYLHALGSK